MYEEQLSIDNRSICIKWCVENISVLLWLTALICCETKMKDPPELTECVTTPCFLHNQLRAPTSFRKLLRCGAGGAEPTETTFRWTATPLLPSRPLEQRCFKSASATVASQAYHCLLLCTAGSTSRRRRNLPSQDGVMKAPRTTWVDKTCIQRGVVRIALLHNST